MRHLLTATAVAGLLSWAAPASALQIVINNLDDAGEGFNDPTPATPIGNNNGTTVGEQRLIVFETAAAIWESILQAPGVDIVIQVDATFDALSCGATSAVLGSAGALYAESDFANAEFPGTWYHIALANRRANTDLVPDDGDIRTRFNSALNGDVSCLNGRGWYLGLDGNEGVDIELLPVVLHELAHGLGFSTFVNSSTGEEFLGQEDVYSRYLFDENLDLSWPQMSSAQRASSAITPGQVVWTGDAANFAAQFVLDPAVQIQVTAPPALVGPLTDFGVAGFGPSLADAPFTGQLVLIDDGNGTTSDGCSPAVNAAQLAGNVALIDRGTCSFVSKVQAAQAAGAIGVVIVNNVPDAGPIAMGGTDPGTLTIAAISVSFEQGGIWKDALGDGVVLSVGPDPNRRAGTSAESGRLLVYTPNPLQQGSSVSHWDVSATPSLLMEPAITGGLSDGVDLTRQHFEDIGWLDPRLTSTDGTPVVARTALRANVPNPFNPSTTIAFDLARDGRVELTIFDNAGRRVRSLVDGMRTAGPYEVQWNGVDDAGRPVASGVYHARLRADGVDEARPMVLLK